MGGTSVAVAVAVAGASVGALVSVGAAVGAGVSDAVIVSVGAGAGRVSVEVDKASSGWVAVAEKFCVTAPCSAEQASMVMQMKARMGSE